jgi:predicted Zn-ribbon and HTH transcriptional regulator
MSRPTLEVADIIRAVGNRFWEKHKSHLAWVHRKVLDAIVRCRTAALGGHRDKCVRCGHVTASYNSCRNRHCPKCQGNVRAKWLAARAAELLPVPYFHIVFTLPHQLCALILQNKRLLYDLLFRTSAASLLELARDPKHLEADIGFLGVLHTWGQNLQAHPHVHYIVPAGGLALDGSRWIDSSRRFFLPVEALSHVFRRKFCEELRGLFEQDRLQFHNSLEQLAPPGAFSHFLWQLGQKDWVVYAKPPFGGAEHVLNYLARYTHRVAISNHRLVAFENDRVSFRWRDYTHGGKKKIMTVSTDKFLRRFLLHVLPKGLVRIRHFGLFANRRRETALARCRELLGAATSAEHSETTNLPRCPACSATMLVIERFTSAQLYFQPHLCLATPQRCIVDSS